MKNIKIKKLCILLFLLLLYTFICVQSYVSAVSTNLSSAVFRLHVLANSDSDEDQSLKIKVRDGLLNYMNGICANCSTKEEAISLATAHENDFQQIAEKIINDNGYNYSVKIKINNFYWLFYMTIGLHLFFYLLFILHNEIPCNINQFLTISISSLNF